MSDLYSYFLSCKSVQIDSRICGPGDLFFALHGTTDGNQFAQNALDVGATWAVVDDPSLKGIKGCYYVEDTLKTLQQLALMHRRQRSIPILALTGSNGKTTTKELLAHALATKFNIHATPGNFNNHIGVPLTLLGINQDTEMAIVEMGANAQGEIAGLCNLAEPDFGLITNIGLAHLEGFGGEQGVRKGKGELFDYLKKNQKLLFYVEDEFPLSEMVGDYPLAKSIRFGPNPAPGVVQLLQTDPGIHLRFMDGQGQIQELRSPLFGIHNARNILNALLVGIHFEVPGPELAKAIGDYAPQNNRSQLIQINGIRLIMDAYNANPGSMTAALESFALIEDRPKLALLGDMLELGAAGPEKHQEVVDHLMQKHIPALLVGSLFMATRHPSSWPVFSDATSAEKWLKTQNLNNYVLLVKGSRGLAMEKAVKFLLDRQHDAS